MSIFVSLDVCMCDEGHLMMNLWAKLRTGYQYFPIEFSQKA